MKLLFCPICSDVTRLITTEWRKCYCGASGGQYNKDAMTATLGGQARVFGVANPFFEYLWMYMNEEQRERVRKDMKYGPGDCWWGEFPGDNQIVRIESSDGPRIAMRVIPEGVKQNRLRFMDKRPYAVDRIQSPKEIIVPSNPQPSFKGKKK